MATRPYYFRIIIDDEARQIIKQKIFKHPDWLALDRGTLSEELAIQQGVERTQLSHDKIIQLFKAGVASI